MPSWYRMFPTPVGMNRADKRGNIWSHNVPHTRGDEPPTDFPLLASLLCSPHPWG